MATDTDLQVDRHISYLNLHSVFLPVVGVEEDMARHDNDHCVFVNTADMAELLRTTLSKEPEISMCVAKLLAVLCSLDYEVSHETFKYVDRDFMLSSVSSSASHLALVRRLMGSRSREGLEFRHSHSGAVL
ncbi:hypothetical protein GCG54_00015309 [Colletotrichum gloeosporioides]|uniref:Uncharacterized protein n=1 Tax=Colletotrichum gloeosporioides TaxID=474922 RepID=A0A8H4FE85_COLGL|nr:uncharacterized protein GCG54_00015309 [Colletotrichum gloeosporioides]KAF3799127.1 hypothetical protein GCG54_00015309 [Colletotrichum gloeosporioides]